MVSSRSGLTPPPSRQGRGLAIAYVLVALAPVLWGANFMVGRAVHGDVSPVSMTFWRWAITVVVLLPFAAGELRLVGLLIRRHWALIAGLALSGIVVSQTFIFWALQSTAAVNAALIYATVPAVIPVVTCLVDRQGLSHRQVLGLAISTLGVAVMILRGDLAAIWTLNPSTGDILMCLAAAGFAVHTALLKRLPTAVPARLSVLAIGLVGTAMMTPLLVWDLALGGGATVGPDDMIAIAFVGLFGSALAYIFWSTGVGRLGAPRAGHFVHLMPVSAAALSIAFLGESLQPFHLVGMALIALGLFASNRARPRLHPRPGKAVAAVPDEIPVRLSPVSRLASIEAAPIGAAPTSMAPAGGGPGSGNLESSGLVGNKGVGPAFQPEGRHRPVTGDERNIIAQRPQLFAD